MVSLWPRSSVTQWSLLLAPSLSSLSISLYLPLSLLSLSVTPWGDSNNTEQNKTNLFHCCWFSLSFYLSLSVSISLSLWGDSNSHWTTNPCLQALCQHNLFFFLSVSQRIAKYSQLLCVTSQNTNHRVKESLNIKKDLITVREISIYLQCNKNFQRCWNFCPQLESLGITPLFAVRIVWFYAPRTGDFYRDFEIFKVICKVTRD